MKKGTEAQPVPGLQCSRTSPERDSESDLIPDPERL